MHYRDSYINIDLDRIAANVELISARAALPHLYAVVKANGYGHGDKEVAGVALESGADRISVAFLDEALRLRRFFKSPQILVMGVIRAEDLEIAAEHQIDICCHDLSWAQQASVYRGPPVRIHLKLDTGMNRIGFTEKNELEQALALLESNPALQLVGLFTHCARADEADTAHYERQLESFKAWMERFDLSRFETVHLANSASLLRFDAPDWINAGRLGIAMYGLVPSESFVMTVAIRQALSLHARVVQLKEIPAGAEVSYGGTFRAKEPTRIATLPIGYADGWLRYHQGRSVMIHDQLYPLVGRICMDQCMVAVDERVQLGDRVDLLNDQLSITDAARDLKTINYEIVCSLSDRLPRRYLRQQTLISERNDRFDF